MRYYQSSSNRKGSVVHTEKLSKARYEPIALNAKVTARENNDFLFEVLSEHNGKHGIAYLLTYRAGFLHTVCLKLRIQSAKAVRLEVHGSATRMQKIVTTIDRHGAILFQAEEINTLSVKMLEDGFIEVDMSFVPFRSLREWFYIFAEGEDLDGTQRTPLPLFSAGPFELRIEDHEPKFRSMAHQSAKLYNNVMVAVQNLTIIRNYAFLQFEIHKPGAQLIGIDVSCESEIAHAQWWSWNPISTLCSCPPPLRGSIRLQVQKPSTPISSPALMDLLGLDFVHWGHAITLLKKDLPDFSSISFDASDSATEIMVHAHFDDGSSHDINVSKHALLASEKNPWIDLVAFHLDAKRQSSSKSMTILEVGARGLASAEMRKLMLAAGWKYLGVDIGADSNVDIIADAHDLRSLFAENSVESVYSSAVIEHLVSPIDFVLEANKVLVIDGYFLACAPCIWPLHAEPWDFWRFTQHGWQGLLNESTGFEIIEVCEFGEASVVPAMPFWTGGTRMALSPSPLLTGVIARKIANLNETSGRTTASSARGKYDPA